MDQSYVATGTSSGAAGHFMAAASFPVLEYESERLGVFHDGAFRLRGDAGGERRVNFHGDLDLCAGVSRKDRNDFIGHLPQAHLSH